MRQHASPAISAACDGAWSESSVGMEVTLSSPLSHLCLITGSSHFDNKSISRNDELFLK